VRISPSCWMTGCDPTSTLTLAVPFRVLFLLLLLHAFLHPLPLLAPLFFPACTQGPLPGRFCAASTTYARRLPSITLPETCGWQMPPLPSPRLLDCSTVPPPTVGAHALPTFPHPPHVCRITSHTFLRMLWFTLQLPAHYYNTRCIKSAPATNPPSPTYQSHQPPCLRALISRLPHTAGSLHSMAGASGRVDVDYRTASVRIGGRQAAVVLGEHRAATPRQANRHVLHGATGFAAGCATPSLSPDAASLPHLL